MRRWRPCRAGTRRSWCFSSGARCRTSVAADSPGTAPSRRVRRGAAARLRPTSPPARLGPCTICRAISWRCRRSGGRRGRAAARSPASSARSPASSAAAVHGAHGGSAHGPAHAATKPQQPPLRAGSGPDDARSRDAPNDGARPFTNIPHSPMGPRTPGAGSDRCGLCEMLRNGCAPASASASAGGDGVHRHRLHPHAHDVRAQPPRSQPHLLPTAEAGA